MKFKNDFVELCGGNKSAFGYLATAYLSTAGLLTSFYFEDYWGRLISGFVLSLVVLRLSFRYFFALREKEAQKTLSSQNLSVYLKKDPNLEVANYTKGFNGLIGNVGMITALLFVLAAFEWRTYDDVITFEEICWDEGIEEVVMQDVPITQHQPPKPVSVSPTFVEVPDENIILDEPKIQSEEIQVDEDGEKGEENSDLQTFVKGGDYVDDIVEEVVMLEEVILMPEDNAEFPGGEKAFLEYIRKSVYFTPSAKRMSIEGTVIVQFVIEKDGSIGEVKVARGLGYGLDEIAKKAVENSPKWKPAKNRGRAVRLSKYIPIRFTLNNTND